MRYSSLLEVMSEMQEMMTRAEAAEFLRVSLRTFDTLVAEGRIPRYRVSRQLVRFRREDLVDYIERNRVEPEESVSAAVDSILGR